MTYKDLAELIEVESGDRPDMSFVSFASFHLETGLVGMVAGRYELAVFVEMVAQRGHVISATTDSSVCATVHKGSVRLVLSPRRCQCDFIQYLSEWF